MEHLGVEAPYTVVARGHNSFNVYDVEDEDMTHPIARDCDAATAEVLTLAHFDTEGARPGS